MIRGIRSIVVLGAVGLGALPGCGHRVADSSQPHKATGDSSPPSIADSITGVARISIDGPTLILAVQRPVAGDSSHEATEADDDRSYYFGRAADFLEARGVRAVSFLADTVKVLQDGKDSSVVVGEGEPLVYFATPGRASRSFQGFDSDGDIIDAAAAYFWAGRVPGGGTDTLTPAMVSVDFVVTRPTVIAFLSRRALTAFSRIPPTLESDSARLVAQVDSLRGALDSGGVTLQITFQDRFTVLGRGAVDTIVPIRSGTAMGYYAANPDDWRTDIMAGFWPTSRLVSEINRYLNRTRSVATHRD